MGQVRKRDPESTKAALLDAAEAVFLEKGYGNTALSEIAKHAGITKSLIHHYFGSKKGLWEQVKLRRFVVYAEQQLRMIETASPSVELLRASMAFYFDFLKQNPETVRLLSWISLEMNEDGCFQNDRELISAGVEKIREAQRLGYFRTDIDPRFILFVFTGLSLQWFQHQAHFEHSYSQEGLPDDVNDAYLQAIIKVFFEGVLPR